MDDDKNWGWWVFWLFVALGLIRLAVKAINISAAWVAAHYILCLCILAVICVIAYFLIFPKWYIKTPQGPEVDPLLYKAARFTVRENLSGEKSKIVHALPGDKQRATGLFYELLFAGVLKTKDWTHFKVPDLNKWDLKEVFEQINSNPHFFSDAVVKWMGEVQSSFEVQEAKADNDEDRQIISIICTRRVLDIAIGFLSYNLSYFPPESADGKKALEETLAKAKKKYAEKTNLVEKEEAIAVLQDSIQLLETTIDDLSIDSVNLKGLSINGSPFDIPRIEREEWELYLLPSFAVLFRDKFFDGQEVRVRIVYYRDIEVSGGYYTEEAGDFDTEGMEYEWRWEHQRVDGGPDMRYNENKKIYSYKFFRVDIPQLLLKQDFRLRSQAEGLIQDFEALKALATDSKGGDPRCVQL